MRKVGSIALAALLGIATPVFMAQSAGAQEAAVQGAGGPGAPACASSGFNMDPTCGPAPYVIGFLAIALLDVLLFVSTENHHQQVSP